MKRVLLAILGETPQILTEVIYYYYHRDPNFRFDKILVLTTTLGRQSLYDQVFVPGILRQLAATLKCTLAEIPFTPNDIIVFTNEAGEPLDDVRTDAEIQATTLQFYTTLQQLTSDDQSQIIATIAGGRKHMGAALALGLQLFGRTQDRLVHVLVKKKRESGDWFFPQSEAESDDIEVSEVPFIRIRSYLPNQQLSDLEPSSLLKIAQQTLDHNAPIRKFVIRDNKFIVDGETIRLSPHRAMIIRYLARQKTDHCQRPANIECGDCHACYVDIKGTMTEYWNSKAYYEEYKQITADGFLERRQEVGKITHDQIRSHISKTKKDIQEQLRSLRIQRNFQILSVQDPRETDQRYHLIGLSVDKNAIEWDE